MVSFTSNRSHLNRRTMGIRRLSRPNGQQEANGSCRSVQCPVRCQHSVQVTDREMPTAIRYAASDSVSQCGPQPQLQAYTTWGQPYMLAYRGRTAACDSMETSRLTDDTPVIQHMVLMRSRPCSALDPSLISVMNQATFRA